MSQSITVFFPAFNDEATIGDLVSDALSVLPTLTNDFEVIVVDDGSTDSTPERLAQLMHEHPDLRVIRHDTNRGYGGALLTGFSSATKDLIFYTDGDGQYDVRELLLLRPLLVDGVDIVNGYKIKRADTWSRKSLGAVYNRLAHLLFSIPIQDVDCDFRLVRRRAIERVELVSSSGSICVELVHKLHCSGRVFAETPVHHYPRLHGRSEFFTPRHIWRTILDLLSLRLRLSASGTNRRDEAAA